MDIPSNLWDKLKALKTEIKKWHQQKRAGDPYKISNLEVEIDREKNCRQFGLVNGCSWEMLAKMKDSLWELHRKEERSWRQKSRLKWLQEGDKNTKFFHLAASFRRSGNYIDKLIVQGNLIDNPGDIRIAITEYFVKHFNSSQVVRIKDWSCNIRSLNMSSSIQLERSFSENEVWNVINRSDGNKAPGPDGFNMHFFKTYWSLIKADVMRIFEQFFESGSFDKRLNASFIALILKCTSALGLNEFRPISLVGCIYKILAKVLANRLRDVIDKVIGPNQFSFIKGRQILDCSLVANEVIDEIEKKRTGGLIFKVDFEKAYDSVDWSFMDSIMAKMGFGVRWRKWINACVSTASLSVLINGTPSRQFRATRGIRQGCPLSPFLFNIVAEALSSLIYSAVSSNLFKGIKVGSEAVMVSHLQFADNTIIFCEPDLGQILNMKRVLRCYQVMSGLNINL